MFKNNEIVNERKARQLQEAKEKYNEEVNSKLSPPVKMLPKFFQSLITEILYSGVYNSIYAMLLAMFSVVLGTQGRIKVRTTNGSTSNLNVFFEIIGPPGSGKTRAINFMLEPNYAKEREKKILFEKSKIDEIKEIASLRLEKKRIEREYLLKATTPEQLKELKLKAEEIAFKLACRLPKDCSQIINSATASAILKKLEENRDTLTIVATEGLNLLKDRLANDTSLLNESYDGNSYSRSTIDSGTTEIDEINFNMIFSLQNDVAYKLHYKNAERWNGSGFMSRILPVIYTSSMNGGPSANGHNSFENYHKYLKKISNLYARTDSTEEIILEMDDELREEIIEWIESYKFNNTLIDSTNILARIELHVMKITAILTLLEDPSAETINRKAFIAATHLFSYFERMHHVILEDERLYNIDAIEKDAVKVLAKIREGENLSVNGCSSSWLVARALPHRRSMDSLQPVLDYLLATDQIYCNRNNYAYHTYV